MRQVAWKTRIIAHFLGLIERYPRWVIFWALFLAACSLWYTAQFLTFKTARNDLISPKREYNQHYLEYVEDFGSLESLVVVVESPAFERSKAFVLQLAQMLEKDRDHIQKVLYRIDPSFFEEKALLYLPLEKLQELRKQVKTHQDFLQALSRSPSLNTLFDTINEQASAKAVGTLISGLLGRTKAQPKEEITVDLRFLHVLIREMTQQVANPTAGFVSPWDTFFLEQPDRSTFDGFYASENGQLLFMLVFPVAKKGSFIPAEAALTQIRRHIAELHKEFPDVQAGVTGAPALATDEMMATQRDTLTASFLSLLGIGLLFAMTFRRMRGPLHAVVTLLIAIAWTFGFITLTVGSLNVLTVVFTPILIGLGIDFGIHLITRYSEERESGKDFHEALRITFHGTGAGIISGGLTTAFAFYTTLFTDFQGIRELGWIAGSGILLCLFAMLTVLPAFLVIRRRRRVPPHHDREEQKRTFAQQLYAKLFAYPRTLLVIGSLITLLALTTVSHLSFDYNLLRLQAQGTESVEYEMKILQHSERSTWFGVVIADTLSEALQKQALLKQLPSVRAVEGITSLIPDQQEAKLQLLQDLKPLLAPLHFDSPGENRLDMSALLSTLDKLRFKIREDTVPLSSRPKNSEVTPGLVRKEMDRFIEQAHRVGEESARSALLPWQAALFQDLQDKFHFLQDHLDPSPVTLGTLPPDLRERFVGKSGRVLLQIFPQENIWEEQFLRQFVTELRSVDPRATGAPIQFYETSRLMRKGFEEAGIYALFAIIAVTLLDFRSPRGALFSLVPLAIGGSWMIGLMWVFDLQFNLANLMVLPLIIGIGVDNGIHIIHRYREEGGQGTPLILKSTGKAVTICSLTTMLGLGSLMVAEHRGIFSLGLLLTLGIGSILIASLTVLPALLQYWTGKGWKL